MAHDVFVSYSSKDEPTVDAVCAILESRGIRCWVASRDILPGHDWAGSIMQAIKGAHAMVLVFSANANTSVQIKREVKRAVNKGIPVIPLRIENVAPTETLEYFIRTPQWLDAFTPPLERHLEYLADVVQKIISGPEDSRQAAERELRQKEETEADRLAEEKRKATELAELKAAEERRAEEARLTDEKRKAAELRGAEERRAAAEAESARMAEERWKAAEIAELELQNNGKSQTSAG